MLMEKTKNQLINEELMQPKQHYRNDNEVRIAVVETTIGHINESLIRMEKRFDKIDERFDRIDGKLETMDKKIEAINNRMWTNFLWLLGVMSAFSVGLLGIMAKGFNWIGN